MGVMKRTTKLTHCQQLELNRYLTHKERTPREVRRAQAILLLNDLADQALIKQITGYERRATFQCRQRYLALGLEGLRDKRKSNAKRLLSTAQREEVLKLLKTSFPMEFGYEVRYWTTGVLADLIKRSYNVTYQSKTSYYLLFKQSHLSFHKPGRVYEKHDPERAAQWREEKKPILEAAMQDEDTLVLVEDEMVLSSQTTFQKIWLPKGEYPKIEVSNTKVNRSIYGFLNLKTGRAHAYKKECQNMYMTVECLSELRKVYPNKKLFILWDGAGWHRGSEVQKFIAEDQHIETLYFPPYSPEENPQEHVWKTTRAAVSHNRFIDNIDAVADDFVNHIGTHLFPYELLGFSARS